MKKAIYKIENKINHKIYIGQTNDPDRRWREHCAIRSEYISLLERAINKYGKENFSFEVLGWFEDYNEKEQEFITSYRCLAPNGYNIAIGGNEPPHWKGEQNPTAKISNETAALIKRDLKNWDIPRKQIVKKYNITQDIIRHINDGTSWHDDNEIYPLRPAESEINNIKADKIINLLITSDIPMNQLGPMFGWGRSSAKMINQGHNHHKDDLIYPIRNHKEENKAILNL